MKKAIFLVFLAFCSAGSLYCGTITVAQPAGGNVAMGAALPIAWTASGVTGNFKIQLIRPGGALVGPLMTNIAASPQSWTVAAPAVAGESYKIRVHAMDGSADGESAQFTVVVAPVAIPYFILFSPNGNESWEKGSAKFISWTAVNMPVNCRLLLLKEGQVLGTIKDSLNPGEGGSAIPWKAGEYLGGAATVMGSGYKIRIESIDGQYSDTSDNPFTITVPHLVYHPVDPLLNLGKLTLLPDLIVCLNWHGDIPNIYQHKRVYVRVKNVGLANAPPCEFKVYVEGHGTLNYLSPWLAPNAESSWSQLYEWKSCGHKTVRATVDPEGLIAESNENNNMLEGRIEVSCSGQPGYLLEMNRCSDQD